MRIKQLHNATSKTTILNNAHSVSLGMGQLFERWGEIPDHDNLNLKEDIALLGTFDGRNLAVLARSGGVKPGSGKQPDPIACGAGLAAFLVRGYRQ
jgi:hypothetical protein